MAKTTPNHIERSVLIQAPRDRVWDALTNAKEFGEWFHVHMRGNFAFEPDKIRNGGQNEKEQHHHLHQIDEHDRVRQGVVHGVSPASRSERIVRQ